MPADGASATETARGTVERVEPSKAQRAFARRVAESKATAPHIYLEADLATDAVERVVAAAGKALREFPRLNGAYRDGAFETYSRVNVGVVIEAGEAPAVPTIFDADQKDEAEIEGEIERLREGAATGSLTPPELAGGTFTVVPVPGAVRSFAPILHQGQAATLAVTASAATLACDARMVTAGEAAQFLSRMRALLETGE